MDMPFVSLTRVSPSNHMLDGHPDPQRTEHLWGDACQPIVTVVTYTTHDRIPTVGLPPLTNVSAQRKRRDECIRCQEGVKAMRPFAKLLWTFVYLFIWSKNFKQSTQLHWVKLNTASAHWAAQPEGIRTQLHLKRIGLCQAICDCFTQKHKFKRSNCTI